jgi:hypothetical protein
MDVTTPVERFADFDVETWKTMIANLAFWEGVEEYLQADVVASSRIARPGNRCVKTAIIVCYTITPHVYVDPKTESTNYTAAMVSTESKL